MTELKISDRYSVARCGELNKDSEEQLLTASDSQADLALDRQSAKLGRMGFPMLAVKGDDCNFSDRGRLQTAHIDAVTVGMRSRDIERLDPARFTKQMLGDTGVECVSRQRFRALDETEPRLRDDEMKKPAFAADRTVAFDGFNLSLCFDLKLDPAAMASTPVFDQLNLELDRNSPVGYRSDT